MSTHQKAAALVRLAKEWRRAYNTGEATRHEASMHIDNCLKPFHKWNKGATPLNTIRFMEQIEACVIGIELDPATLIMETALEDIQRGLKGPQGTQLTKAEVLDIANQALFDMKNA